eukprot:m.18272 g.18272  ORF g.18272 m.18272 type:complete len:281 (+) comp5293_c0_seq1:44-886(+)
MLQLGRVQVAEKNILQRSESGLALSLGNINPCVPGHAIVVPTRPDVKLLADLTPEELADFSWLIVKTEAIQRQTLDPTPTAFNVSIKDGPAAGQAMPLLHAHVCPRRSGDLKPDEIFSLIERWTPEVGEINQTPPADWPDDETRGARTAEVMFEEATDYAKRAADLGIIGGVLPDGPVKFGPKITLSHKQCFFASSTGKSVATVNLKPLLPGHVLVIPRTSSPTLASMAADELDDLWDTVRQVQAIVKGAHGKVASDLGIQDGPDAGQSVPHVHIHVIPR